MKTFEVFIVTLLLVFANLILAAFLYMAYEYTKAPIINITGVSSW